MTKKMINRLVQLYDTIYADFPYQKSKTVAFVIYKNHLLSFGVNSNKTSQTQNHYRRKVMGNEIKWECDKTHAEIAAIKKIDIQFNDFKNLELLIVSKKKNGKFRCARPCEICSYLIREKGIRKIYYTNEFEEITLEKRFPNI